MLFSVVREDFVALEVGPCAARASSTTPRLLSFKLLKRRLSELSNKEDLRRHQCERRLNRAAHRAFINIFRFHCKRIRRTFLYQGPKCEDHGT